MIALLSGGTGTPKLLQGIMEIVPREELAVIVNTAEDEWLPHGHLSPDIDTVMYTLAGLINDETWYGIKGDTFSTHDELLARGFDEFMNIGDRDRATHIHRGELLKGGMSLEEVIEIQKNTLGIKASIIPMTNEIVRTHVISDKGDRSLHEYLILYNDEEVVRIYQENPGAEPCPGVLKVLEKSDLIIIGPSNPMVSTLPIINLKGVKKVMEGRRDKTIAISPIIGDKPVSGPVDKFFRAHGKQSSPGEVAGIYREIVGNFIIHNTDDDREVERIRKMGVNCHRTNTIMKSLEDKIALGRFILDMMGYT